MKQEATPFRGGRSQEKKQMWNKVLGKLTELFVAVLIVLGYGMGWLFFGTLAIVLKIFRIK